jgi:hypothetical protein
MKKKKQRKTTDLKSLMTKSEERDFLLGLLDDNRSVYIKECLEYFPLFEVDHDIKVNEETQIGVGDVFQLIVSVKTNRLGNFCDATTYPFLKMEGWHLIVSDTSSNAIALHEYFIFD